MLRQLGTSELHIAPLALGTDNFGNPSSEKASLQILNKAIGSGINLIDTSNSYAQGESERIIGKGLKQSRSRSKVFIATKVYYPTGPLPEDSGHSRKAIIKACEASLIRLQTDYIDLYQLHRPDFSVPLDETLSALDELHQAGKIRYIGSSTSPAGRIIEGLELSQARGYPAFVSEQPPYNLLDRRIELETIPCCQSNGLGVITWSPLAMGILAGRYTDTEHRPSDSRSTLRGGIYAERVTQAGIQVGSEFVKLAKTYGYDPAQLALLWVKDQPGITAPLMGPRTLAQLDHFLAVLEMVLPENIREACDQLVGPGSFVANFHNSADWMK